MRSTAERSDSGSSESTRGCCADGRVRPDGPRGGAISSRPRDCVACPLAAGDADARWELAGERRQPAAKRIQHSEPHDDRRPGIDALSNTRSKVGIRSCAAASSEVAGDGRSRNCGGPRHAPHGTRMEQGAQGCHRRRHSAGGSAAGGRRRMVAALRIEPDVYATGLSLVALNEAGMRVDDRVYRRGVDFLLGTQYPDGAWLVVRARSRFSRISKVGSHSIGISGFQRQAPPGRRRRLRELFLISGDAPALRARSVRHTRCTTPGTHAASSPCRSRRPVPARDCSARAGTRDRARRRASCRRSR